MQKVNLLAVLLLLIMSGLMWGSVWNDAATFDEVAHIPAGYANVAQLDYRLNPEHPPLLKALAGFSVWLFVRPFFPVDTSAWQQEINGQWRQGALFLYESGNDADAILFWARVPMIAVTLLLGVLIFWWVHRRFGNAAALIALMLYVFSPTLLAHGRYVTTDVGAALGFFVGIVAYLAFLEQQNWKHLLIAGIAFGFAQLMKFSLILLIPVFGIMLVLWVWTRTYLSLRGRIKLGGVLILKTIIIGSIGVLLIWISYAPFVLRYPREKQRHDAFVTLANNPFHPGVEFDLTLIRHPITRPLGQYLFGLMMATQRVGGGNTRYFLGEVSSEGSPWYFPIMYVVKESLAFHLLTLIAVIAGFKRIFLADTQRTTYIRIRAWIRAHFAEVSLSIGIGIYWITSITTPLNIGIRHILPTLPLIFILVGRGIAQWFQEGYESNPHTWGMLLFTELKRHIVAAPKISAIMLILIWHAAGSILFFPYFLSYYNALARGPEEGVYIATDSNLDWGQDLKRLRSYIDKKGIDKIAIDYFGGGSPRYYFGDRFEPWWSARGEPRGWFAISANVRQGAWGRIGSGFTRKPEDSYEWLNQYEPIDRIGYSIFVYRFP
ncbi:MAG: hypothetical protein G01um101466_659 [Parcubacteria group bacterium Gr01-1014_66]|nr:MAG: hypothetical protein G01um101466_659 [Parcubacteria group bacterium Gr01-1014_66]